MRRRGRLVRVCAALAALSGAAVGCAGAGHGARAFADRLERLDRAYAAAEREVLARRERLVEQHDRFADALLEAIRERRRRDEFALIARQLALEPLPDGSTRLDPYVRRLGQLYDELERSVRERTEAILDLLLLERDEQLELLEAERLHKRRRLEWLSRRRGG